MTERVRLKNLLKKAKTAIDSVSAKYKQSADREKQLENHCQQVLEKNKDLV
jgi:hypothetical protein